MTSRHPHADERRRPSLDQQLEGARLFVQDEATPLDQATVEKVAKSIVPPGPHRVGRRAFAQDVAHAKAALLAKPMREVIYEHLLGILPAGQTRESIALATGYKLQTVCGRINDLLKWEVGGMPAPRVREGALVNGAALVYAIPSSHSHTHGANK